MSEYTKALEDAAARRRKFRIFHKKHRTFFESLVADLERFKPNIFPLEDSLDVTITGDVHVLTETMRILYRHGLTEPTSKPVAKQPSYSAYFNQKGYDGNTPRVWLSFSSSVCRRVKVGTKTIEQDVYEVVCGETIVEDAAPSSIAAQEYAAEIPF